MFHHQNSPHRRYLTAPTSLLSSLSSLSSQFSSSSFPIPLIPSLRRPARTALRFAAILLPFLDSLPSHLSLSHLHLTLQNLTFLLADSSRPPARLLSLLLSPLIVARFRLLFRSLASSLHLLKPHSFHLGHEIQDLLHLVITQGGRIEFHLEEQDEILIHCVKGFFGLFEFGEVPHLDDLKGVFKRLKIESWMDCFDQVLFLEEEILALGEERDGVDLSLVWSLMGVIVYAMVVLFDETLVCERRVRSCCLVKESSVFVGKINGESLLCPISLQLMKDPVTVSTGQTYDRNSILRWIKSGKKTCPVTGEILKSFDLIPNFSVRHLICVYCNQNGILVPKQSRNLKKRDLQKMVFPASLAAVGAIRLASTVLVAKLAGEELKKKNFAAFEIRMLSKSNIFNRICFVEAGAVKPLLSILSFSLSSSDFSSLEDNAAAALLNLSKHQSGRTEIFDYGGIPIVVKVMKFGHKIEAQKNSAAILFYLSSLESCREAIGEIPEAIPALINLLKNGTYRAKKNAIVTIYGLLLFSPNQVKILDANIVGVISELFESEKEEEEEDLVIDCIGVLAKIAERVDGTNEIMKKTCVLSHIVYMLGNCNSASGKEYCVSTLLFICKNSGDKAICLLEKMPLLMPLLYSLLSDGSQQASKKARSLLNYIHEFNDERYSPCFVNGAL